LISRSEALVPIDDMNLQNTLTLAVAAFILILVMGAGAVYLTFFAEEETISVPSEPFSNIFPFSGSKAGADVGTPAKNNGNDTPTAAAGTISVVTLDGVMDVRDFTKDADVGTTVENDAFYVVFPKEAEFSDKDLQYEVGYAPEERRMYVTIYKEPIGTIRLKAAADLAERLSLSGKDLCNLDALVIAPRWVNEYYADKNLGFPGCPNGVKFDGDPVF